ncbi:hypothetical protein [Microbacterium sediminis]|uniref:Uncharacterized protein n=1 Tax=Microbacterium sediminis TaxID=904291 RepID=A0A1B9NDE5_9MICO|nr:hypothetical protein [Microbacterium sediminis]OCG74625.1 hypothetical protein A7J15_03575 [Microbacterium sediminis]QBR74920.1 hypothetical protein E3O41_11305 [Microbacterium sediminis]
MSNPPDQPAVPPGEGPSEPERVVPPEPAADPPAWTPPGGDAPQAPPIPPAPTHAQPYAQPGPQGAMPPYGPPGAAPGQPYAGPYPYAYPAPAAPPRQVGGLAFGWGVLIGLLGAVLVQVAAITILMTPSGFFGLLLIALLFVAGIVLVCLRATRSLGVGVLISVAAMPIVIFGTCVVVLSGV